MSDWAATECACKPVMGIEFDVVKGSGAVIFDPIRSMDQVRLGKVSLAQSSAEHARLASSEADELSE